MEDGRKGVWRRVAGALFSFVVSCSWCSGGLLSMQWWCIVLVATFLSCSILDFSFRYYPSYQFLHVKDLQLVIVFFLILFLSLETKCLCGLSSSLQSVRIFFNRVQTCKIRLYLFQRTITSSSICKHNKNNNTPTYSYPLHQTESHTFMVQSYIGAANIHTQ